MHRVIGSNPSKVRFFSFMHPPCCYLTLHNELLNQTWKDVVNLKFILIILFYVILQFSSKINLFY
jgi:hypothetical protein